MLRRLEARERPSSPRRKVARREASQPSASPDPMVTMLVPLAIAAVLGLIILDVLIRRPVFGASLVMGVVVIITALEQLHLALPLGTAQLELDDPVFLLLLAAGVARYLRLQRLAMPQRLLVLLGVLLLVSLVRGMPTYGESAVSEFRKYLDVIGGALYFSSMEYSSALRRNVGRIWIYGASALAVVVIARWAAFLTGLNLGPFSASFNYAIRVVGGADTFLFANAFLIAFPAWFGRGEIKGQRALATLFFVIALLLNRRTVWVALLAGLLVLALRDRAWRRRMTPLLAGAAVIGVVASMALPDETVTSDVSVAQEATDISTLEWRVEGWRYLVTEGPSSPIEWAFGQPFGTGYGREVPGIERVLESNPHNFYVQTLLRVGIVGLGVLLALYGSCLRRLLAGMPTERGLLSRDVMLALLVSHMVNSLAWAPGSDQSILIGLAVAAAAASGRRPAAAPAQVGPPPREMVGAGAGPIPAGSTQLARSHSGRSS